MATYTKNINLLKPAEQEKYDVNLRNNNWDKIDKAIGDTSDAIKKHKEANPIDHPDGSVTTPKLKDKCVTPAKLSEELNLKLKNDFVKRSGDTMQGNLTLENNKRVYFNNDENITHASIYINNNNTLDIGVNNLPDKAVNRISLCSVEKPQWYNAKNGTKILATEEYVNTETAKYLPLAGGTMKGDITFKRNQSSIKLDGGNNKMHSIGIGGTDGENLDIGSAQQTSEANLCCYNRPGWYGKDKTNTFKPFLFDDDMVITSGTINDGQILPVPEGFREDECHWLLTPNTINTTDPKENSIGSANIRIIKCYHTNRRVVCGVDLTVDYSINYDGGGGANPNRRYTNWIPGTANYVCICRRRF